MTDRIISVDPEAGVYRVKEQYRDIVYQFETPLNTMCEEWLHGDDAAHDNAECSLLLHLEYHILQ